MKTSKVLLVVVGLLVLSMLAACAHRRRARRAATAQQPAAPADAVGTASCAPNCTAKDLVLCYPQLGAESDWRTANSASFKETAAQLGIKQLVFSDAQQKQENQISAMRARASSRAWMSLRCRPWLKLAGMLFSPRPRMPVSRSLLWTAPSRPIHPCMRRTLDRIW